MQRNLEETLGEYRMAADSVVKVDSMERVLYLSSQAVPFDNLTDLSAERLDEMEAAYDDVQ